MADDRDLTPADRVLRLLAHLGITRAHLGQGIEEFAAHHPAAVASLALIMPQGSIAPALRALAEGRDPAPLFLAYGDTDGARRSMDRVGTARPDAAVVVLRDYESAFWTDVLADRGAEVAPALLAHLAAAQARDPLPPLRLPEREGEVAGITYRVRGSGPPLLLFPIWLVPSQWEPLIPALAERYCTVTLGGPHLGILPLMEERAAGGYGRVVDALLDAIAVPDGGTLLEVGCGSGALSRRASRRLGPGVRVVGVDINSYFLREAIALARREGLGERIAFREGDALALPFPDATFDAAIACTVLEELDADRALAELVRVVRPGGRVGVVVRAGDLLTFDSLPLPPAARAKLGDLAGGATAGGCADASLYRRAGAAGLTDLGLGPQWGTDYARDGLSGYWAFIEGMALVRLDADEAAAFRAAAAQSTADGTYLFALPFHCVVGTRP